MKRIIIKIQSLLNREKKPEVASVPFDKLQQWTDSQYKPHLKTTLEQVRKPLIACKEASQSATELLQQIADFQPVNQRVDVHTKVLNKKHFLQKALKELQTDLQSVDDLVDLYQIYSFYQTLEKHILEMVQTRTEVGEVLQEHMGKIYAQVVQLTHTLDENTKKVRSIFSESQNRNYISTQKLATSIVTKREKAQYYDEKMKLTKNTIVERREEVSILRTNIARIKNDPKYLLEKQSIFNGAGKFGLSFYDLEIDKFEKQVGELGQAIVSLKDHYHKLAAAKDELQINGAMQDFRNRILTDFNIEVDLVDSED